MVSYLDRDEATLLDLLKTSASLSWPPQDANLSDLVSRLTAYGWIEKRDGDQVPAITTAGAVALANHHSDTGRFHPDDGRYIEESDVAATKIFLQTLIRLLIRNGSLSRSDLNDLTKAALDKARESRVKPSTEPSRRYRYLHMAILTFAEGWMQESSMPIRTGIFLE